METLIELLSRVDVVLYFISGLGTLIGVRGYVNSRQMRKVAAFGLEREAVRKVKRRAVNTLASMVVLAGSVYVLTNVVNPQNLGGLPTQDDSSAELTDLSELAVNMTPTERPLLFPTVTPSFGVVLSPGDPTPTPAATLAPDSASLGCEINGVTINQPLPGEVVAGQIQVTGEANILNFAVYKFEVRGPSTRDVWVTVGNFTTPVASGFLGTWDATSLEPGSYFFRLVLVNQSGISLDPCVIPITIAAANIQPSAP